jgi:adenylate cyclase
MACAAMNPTPGMVLSEVRKLASILVGYSRLARADEEGTLARLGALWSDLLDPAIAGRRGRVVKRTGDGGIAAFQSVVDAVRSALEIQSAMAGRNEGVAEDRRILMRIGVHLGDVVEEACGPMSQLGGDRDNANGARRPLTTHRPRLDST